MGRLPGCSESSACWIAGPYRHCRLRGRAVGLARAGTVAGGSPLAPYCLRVWRRGAGLCSCAVRWAVTVVADRQRRVASPVTGIPDCARPASWSLAASLRMCIWSNGSQPESGPLGAGSSWPQGLAGSRDRRPLSCSPNPTGHWPGHSWQVALQSDESPIIAIGTGALGAGRTWTRMRAPASPGFRSDHGS